MFYPGFGYGLPVGRFEQDYHVYPVSFLDKTHLENGDKVIMPPSALDRLASLHIDYPMLFEVQNTAVGRKTHCGVLEFVAEEGCVYMPYWMMQNLLVQEGDLIRLTNATLQKGTYVKLQPHTKDFLDISNPKAVLETTLRNFSCLTTGDNIMVAYNNKKYYIDIVETRPDPAISIIETDCEVDFAAPLDYVEPAYTPSAKPNGATPGAPAAPTFKGIGVAKKKKEKEEAPPPEPEAPKFQAFVGSGRRLDGKPASPAKPSVLENSRTSATATSSQQGGNAAGATSSAAGNGSAPAASTAPRTGRLVFGGGAAALGSKEEKKDKKGKKEEAAKEPEEPKFKAFQGKAYSLK